MLLTEDNYYSQESNITWFSVSQFKQFMNCSARALAELKGDYIPERGRALVLGSYVDEHLTGTPESMRKFITEYYNELYKKNGEPYADVAQADEAINRIRNQPLMLKYLTGEFQKMMTGEIGSVPFKIKMDCYKEGEFISDLKYLSSLRSPNLFTNVVDYWNYTLQGAVYQEIVFQNTGKRLPFYLVIATKEKPCHVAVVKLDQFDMDEQLNIVKANVGRFNQMKLGLIQPERCEEYGCDYCTTTKVLTEPIPVEYLAKSTREIQALKGEL
jgi:hypothetical protein